ncbi:hypothetical protein ACFOWM_04915 [Ferruginibacter yonginensis]|uniref:Uncharacterized protein n=1 Tax=Ferruginibacter yonginensis TaxID=1310416 RepID=A0ABV8QT27_9BACT
MSRKRNPISFPLIIIFIIIAAALWKLINFSNFSIQKPGLALVYAICLIVLFYLMLKRINHKDDATS